LDLHNENDSIAKVRVPIAEVRVPTITVRKIYGDFLYNILLAFFGLPPHKITML
jgi:hypothetical protein